MTIMLVIGGERFRLIQRFTQPETIEIDISKKEVRLNGMVVGMNDADLALYLWMCERRKQNRGPLVPDREMSLDEYILIYKGIVGEISGMLDRVKEIASQDLQDQKAWFQQRKSRLKKAIVDQLGSRMASPFLIQTVDNGDLVGYEIGLDKKRILLS